MGLEVEVEKVVVVHPDGESEVISHEVDPANSKKLEVYQARIFGYKIPKWMILLILSVILFLSFRFKDLPVFRDFIPTEKVFNHGL